MSVDKTKATKINSKRLRPAQKPWVLKELVRPYYLKWLYFHLSKDHRPQKFDRWRDYLSVPDGPELPALLPKQTRDVDIVFLPAADWHCLTQRTQKLAMRLAEMGYRCIYLNPHLGREFPQPYLASRHRTLVTSLATNIVEVHIHLPLEPVYHHRCLSAEETKEVTDTIAGVLDTIESRNQVLVVSFPLWTGVAKQLGEARNAPTIFDCHDLLEGFEDVGEDLVRAEEQLLKDADFAVFSSTWLLQEHVRRQPDLANKSVVIRNAVDAEDYRSTQSERGPTAGPVNVGYVGSVNTWFNINLIRNAASYYPDWTFTIVGPVAEIYGENPFAENPNVRMTGELNQNRLPELMQHFDIGIIPFLVEPLTLAVNPIKMYEYFSCGLPVVSTRLPEVELYGDLVYIADNDTDFLVQLDRARTEQNPELKERRRQVAKQESWLARADALVALFSRVQANKQPRHSHSLVN